VTIPNFFIIGAARCATESLYAYLKQHPQIYMSPTKETNYFVFYGKAIDYCGPGDQEALQSCYVPDREAYEAQFSGVRDETAIGEASPWYIYCPEVPARIRGEIAHPKFIAMLRNPIDRAYSAFGMLHLSNRECVPDFLDALQLEPGRIAANWEPLWHYKSMGMYFEQVKRYYETYDRTQVRCYIYDDFSRDAEAVIQDVFRFLEVDDQFVPDMSVRLNQSYVPKHMHTHAVLSGCSVLKSTMKPLLPAAIRQRLKEPVLNRATGKASVERDVREQLVEVFRDDITKLQDLIGRDLSAWMQ